MEIQHQLRNALEYGKTVTRILENLIASVEHIGPGWAAEARKDLSEAKSAASIGSNRELTQPQKLNVEALDAQADALGFVPTIHQLSEQ